MLRRPVTVLPSRFKKPINASSTNDATTIKGKDTIKSQHLFSNFDNINKIKPLKNNGQVVSPYNQLHTELITQEKFRNSPQSFKVISMGKENKIETNDIKNFNNYKIEYCMPIKPQIREALIQLKLDIPTTLIHYMGKHPLIIIYDEARGLIMFLNFTHQNELVHLAFIEFLKMRGTGNKIPRNDANLLEEYNAIRRGVIAQVNPEDIPSAIKWFTKDEKGVEYTRNLAQLFDLQHVFANPFLINIDVNLHKKTRIFQEYNNLADQAELLSLRLKYFPKTRTFIEMTIKQYANGARARSQENRYQDITIMNKLIEEEAEEWYIQKDEPMIAIGIENGKRLYNTNHAVLTGLLKNFKKSYSGF